MSATAKSVLDEFRKLSATEQEELLQQLLRISTPYQSRTRKVFPTVKVRGGTITSEQVAESLDDE